METVTVARICLCHFIVATLALFFLSLAVLCRLVLGKLVHLAE
jgi:hypothetical protein